MVTFTEKFNIALENSPLNVMQLSKQTGLSRSSIHSLMNGEQIRLYSDNLTVLCKTLGISADWLLGIKGGKSYD